MNQEIIDALSWRYATKIFDPMKRVSDEDFLTILEAGRLAPSNSGLEPTKVLVIENKDIRKQLRMASFDQPQVTDADRFLVITHRTNLKEKAVHELVDRTARIQEKNPEELQGLRSLGESVIHTKEEGALQSWATAQSYIILGTMVEAAALLRVDNCPMGGFQSEEYARILGLDSRHLVATALLALGYRGNDPAMHRKKVRRDFDDFVEFIQ